MTLISLTGLRTARNLVSDADSKIKEYEKTFNQLLLWFRDRAALQTEITVLRILGNVKDLGEQLCYGAICLATNAAICTAMEVDLNDMPYAGGAKFNSQRVCLPGTRTDIINDITDWVNSPDAPRMCLLTGVAGSGKSSIANTVAHQFDDLGRLGSSFCFDRSHAADRRPDNLFSTIARNLADLDAQRKSALWDVVQEKRSLRTTHEPAEQFNKLILLPAAGLM